MPRVLNKRKDTIPPDAIYVGRPSKWGNPFMIGIDGTREEVISKYKSYLLKRLEYDKHFELETLTLRNKDLVCWCAPLPCHADILLELANNPQS